ncbi:helix-turn-helix domain-containing protein [Mobilicoccus pelagius]|uniref:Putative Xre family DNA-binding protein n=1 Tax=Mobilicoccus pelagius NBRC 104925 TaxID=1089455 RepID=H5UNS4_9MICO|nr:helix-turn-helix transcriptional regulator [Mobilicoccus pelagius]GAB47382.1 putative Xre family DNA-binding protein [Mobilicoccus pelagius NBRC 104925]
MPVLLRTHLGEVIRESRKDQGRTLRDVSSSARVSLGYLSEVERGEKEASSELLAAICEALHMPLSQLFAEVSDRFAEEEGTTLAPPVALPVRPRPEAQAPAA